MVDSVQTLWSQEVGSAPGSVSQVREAAARLLRVAKENGVAVFLVGHVTKDGAVAGPRVLEHLVDCVLQFEGDRYHAHRILRAVKNRFGSTNEIGVFEMTGAGPRRRPRAIRAVRPAPAGRDRAAVTCTLEGTRPLLLEVQALVSPTDLAMPRRVGTGVDPKRLAMIVAVLARHAGLPLGGADVFVNVAGGVRIDEPGGDLGIALAIASAAKGAPVREGPLHSGRSASRAACGRRRRPSGGWRSAASSASVRCSRRRGRTERRSTPTRSGVLAAGLVENPSEQGFSRQKPCKRGGFPAILIPCRSRRWSLQGHRHFRDYRRKEEPVCTRSATRWCIPTTVQARS